MKKLLCLIVTLTSLHAQAVEKKLPISVTQFTDKSEGSSRCNYGWWYWHERMGTAFREMLINELVKDPRLQVLERETINDIYAGEHNLVNSDLDKHALKKGAFKKAKFTIVGSVSEYEFCAESHGTGVDVGNIATLVGVPNPFGSVKVGASGASAKTVIDVRIINVETGEIIASIKKEGASEDKHFAIDSSIFSHENENAQPLAQAAREAIRKAADEIIPLLASRI
jgi:curli biogenesis system outer membrane secretion channel CsgG